ncbi:DNRLRE domain-containing protein [Streptomyces sp. SP17KL33]|uniref:DNRLRE domain-containing protein n=1 Tax=Streptomyces sp. SP17KL33 TaxID=3002534 RepID=UPI002E790DC9|nr:DNRLRE domain-containing protein [Streptomyces sp. SP17KL33]MEE1832318.1 DNRLRE domain-containing protein [Streptomyces sp. SP17KL33]
MTAPFLPPARRRRLRSVAATVVLAMAFETAVIVGTTNVALAAGREAPAADRNKPAKDLGSATAGSVAAARLKAKIQNRRIEALDARTETSTTYVNPDGSVTQTAYAGPIRFQDDQDRWQDVDVSLQKLSDGSVGARRHPHGLRLAGKSKAPKGLKDVGESTGSAGVPLVTLEGRTGQRMRLGWYGTLPAPEIEGAEKNIARYRSALPSTDLLIESTRTGYEQYLELKDRSAVDASGAITYSLTAKGLTAKEKADGSVSFSDAKGKAVGVLPAPVMWDAQVDARSGEHKRTAPVAVKVAQDGDTVTLTLTPDAKFLADDSTRFPVTIDPAINVGASFDAFVQEGHTTDESASTDLKLGNNGSSEVARSFLSFPMKNITGKQITAAKLNLFAYHSWSCTPKSWEVWSTGAASTASRWTSQPAWETKYATSTQTKGFSSACNDGWVSADVTALAKAWASGGNGTNHLGLRATDETDPYGWKRFNSGNAASNTPYLSVTYNSIPEQPTLVAPLSAAATNDTTPTLSAKALDGDGSQVTLDYEVWTSTGTSALRTGSSAAVASGAQANWTPAALAAGSYKWRVRAGDGSATSAWSAFRTLTVDTASPAATSVASGDFPAGQWSGAPNGSGDFTGGFTLTPPSADVKEVQWQLDGGAWQTIATAGAAVTAKPVFRAGKHILTARTKDAAGNASAQTTFTFYAGSGAAVLAPAQGDRPARRTVLSGQGKTADTGVRYQYRRGETDTWKDVPVADVRRKSDNTAVAAWPVKVTGGVPDELVWNITDSLAEDGPVDIRAVFTDGSSTDASPATSITVDRDAGAAPTQAAGPGDVNMLTGDYTVSATDSSSFGLTASRTASSRRPTAGGQQEGQVAIFGPQWTAGTAAELTDSQLLYIRRTSSTSVALVDVEGEETGFTATSGGGWKPEEGAESLTLTGSLTGSFTLKDTEGTTSQFTKIDTAATTWQLSKSSLSTENSTTSLISEKVTVGGAVLARPKYAIAPSSAVTNETCANAPSTKGCRILEYQYATTTTATGSTLGDYAGQVYRIRQWSTNPGAANATATVVSSYAYDASGRLREQWDPRISPALKTTYTYDSAGRLVTQTPPGELPWTFEYGKAGSSSVAGEGMVLSVSRPTLKPGSKDEPDGGRAALSLVYDVPLSGTKAPNQVAPVDTRTWAQTDAPTDATAIFPADQVPASHSGNDLGAGDYDKATTTYTNASGLQVNTGLPGRHLTTTQYDAFGNIVFELGATNRELALGSEEYQVNTQSELGILSDSTAERAQKLATVAKYSGDGRRMVDQFGPLHLVTLTKQLQGDADSPDIPARTQVPAREHIVTRYDEGRPTDGSALVMDQPTTTSTGAFVEDYPADADVRTSTTGYDWAKGLPVSSVTDPTGLKLTRASVYDAQGRITKNSQPKSNGADAGTVVSQYWSASGTGACAGRPEWADLLCSSGPAGKITGGGSNPDELPTKTLEYDRWGNATKVTETANGVTRTTVTTYDAAGRGKQIQISGGVGTAVPTQTITFDTANGQVATMSDGATTVHHVADKLGREISYDDGAGNVTRTEYDARDRVTRRSDSAPSETTYDYDSLTGLPTRMHDSVMGGIGDVTGSYDSDGRLYKQKLPWNMDVEFNLDPTGSETSRYWHWESGWTVQGESVSENIHGQVVSRTTYTGGGAYQEYSYDAAGRLTKADDTQTGVTTHRGYGFDDNTNRTSLVTTVDDVDGGAPTTRTVDSTYDSADRLIRTGTAYDAFGRTTTQSSGAQYSYYANDLVRQITARGERTTWSLDAAGRLASSTTESQDEGGAWSTTATVRNHYGADGDNPTWTGEGDSKITRNLSDLTGSLIATTGAAGDVVLQLTNLHGDIATQIPLADATTPVVNTYDEYGKLLPGTDASRYGWLGGEQRSSETPSSVTLMGVRLYDSDTGRFLSVDRIVGGNASSYDYCFADPINCYDISGNYSINGLIPEAAICALFLLWCADMAYITYWALGEAKKRYSNGAKQNAYRHCIWQAMLTWAVGSSLAKALGNAHEKNAGSSAAAKRDSKADQYNNKIGRSLGGKITAWTYKKAKETACRFCKDKVKKHKLKSNAAGKTWV